MKIYLLDVRYLKIQIELKTSHSAIDDLAKAKLSLALGWNFTALLFESIT